ncbi:hypothetical protein B0J13DRAFT_576205 [Dactylonectria estremocensis]|uniref:Anaphase-promoting complex subunit 4 WD40 domain-containing protein n=1 Tax=Dactylonectria estremocensis TaxID=1079267 RepID=A0A9P9I8N1_9HYPO|nr:hypothetical protein B0J13DRAFT_576205 [Dactylonectria estremocensis]
MVFSADGQRLASASWVGTVKVWDAATGVCVLVIEICDNIKNSIRHVAFHSDTVDRDAPRLEDAIRHIPPSVSVRFGHFQKIPSLLALC